MVFIMLFLQLFLHAAVSAPTVIIPQKNAVCEAGVCDHWKPIQFECYQPHNHTTTPWTCTPLPSGQAYEYLRVSCPTDGGSACALRYAAHPPARLAVSAPGSSFAVFANRLTASRRSGPPRAQLQCVGRCPIGGGMFCRKNTAWECLASDQHHVFVSCEGYAASNDTFALANGCSAVCLDACVLWAALGALAGLACSAARKHVLACACVAATVAMCAQMVASTNTMVWKSPDAFFIT